jgi:hypothetical protein
MDVSLDIYFFLFLIFREFLLFAHRCWWGSEWKDEVDWGMEEKYL